MQLLGPGFIAGVLEGRDTALTGVVDENGSRAQRRFAGARKLLHLLGIKHVASLGEQARAGLGVALQQLLDGLLQTLGVAAAQGHAGSLGQQQLHGGQAYARRTAGDDGRGVEFEIMHGRLLRALK